METKVRIAVVSISFLLCLAYLSADTEKVYTGVPEKQKETVTVPEVKPMAKPELKVESGKKVKVEKFLISGNKSVSTDELLAAIEKYKGKELSINQLLEIADILTRKYWEKGYVTSFAYIPVQKLERGILEIEIVEGSIGDIIVKNNKYYTTSFINRYLEDVKKEPILKNRTLERSLLLLNEFPKLNATSTLTKGQQPGTTDIVIDIKEPYPPVNFSVFYNNFGSRYTGEHRLGASVGIGNLTKNGDILSLNGVVNAEDFDQMNYWKAGYQIPIGGKGLKAGIDYSKMEYEIGGELSILGIEGEAEVFGLDISYPLIRAREKNLYITGGIRHKYYENFLFEKTYTTSRDDYSVLELGISGDRFIGKNHLFYSLKSTMGLGEVFGMDDDDYTSSSRPGITDGDWTKFTLDITNITKIGKVQLITRGSGQVATDNLLTSEQFTIGGPDSVRGYPAGEYLGDYGFLLSEEIRIPVSVKKGDEGKYFNLALFADYGRTYYKDELAGDEEGELASVGAGIRIYAPCTFNVRFDAAYPVSSEEASDDNDWRYWLNVSWTF